LAEAAVPLTLRSAHVPGTRPWNLFAALWALGWGTTGALVAAGIHFVVPDTDLWPLMTTSLLFAEVVGFTAFLSARQVFPLFSRLAYPIRLGLQVVTLFSGTVFGSVAVLAAQPLFSLANIRLVSVIVAINAVLAVLVGITLHTYDTMKNQIEASYRALRVKEALERDLAIAREVQRELLPRAFPRFEGLELAGVCLPAVGVGGDYFDFLPLPGERLGVVVADVSGKGIPAALLMAGLQASVRSVSSSGCGPAEVNERVNALLHDTTSDSRYATMFFALYDPELRRIRYSNAGHFPPILLGPQGAVRLTQGGLPLGLFGGSAYGEGSREMQPGDVMVLCTDGLLEAPDRSGREFGETRLVEILERSRGRDLPAVLEEIVRTVRAWTEDGPPHDDITVVLVRSR
jgi:sigma-B regulation protein RsbU (phosphoserine phosphatase)